MARILVVYGTRYGQTEKIARFLADELRAQGHETACLDAGREAPATRKGLERFDAVLVGAPVYRGDYPRAIARWAEQAAPFLAGKPAGFFSVCLGVLQRDDEKVQREEREIVRRFLARVSWQPQLLRIFAGSMPFTRYSWPVRWMMKRIARKAGGDTDTRRDFEYTDWNEVRGLAREVSDLLNRRSAEPAVAAR